MLNFKELSEKFTKKLHQFDAESLAAWKEFDEERELVRKLSFGELVWITAVTIQLEKLTIPDESCENQDLFDWDDYSFAA